MVGAGGWPAPRVGAFLGGLGGYFTVDPAAAHPLASSTTPDQSLAAAADQAHGRRGRRLRAARSACRARPDPDVAVRLADPGHRTAAVGHSPTRAVARRGRARARVTLAGRVRPARRRRSGLVGHRPRLGLLADRRASSTCTLSSCPSSAHTAHRRWATSARAARWPTSTGLLDGLAARRWLPGLRPARAGLAGHRPQRNRRARTRVHSRPSLARPSPRAAASATGSSGSTSPSLPLSAGGGSVPGVDVFPSGAVGRPRPRSRRPADRRTSSSGRHDGTTTVTVPLPALPVPIGTPPVSVGGVSVGVSSSGSGSGLTLSLP